MSDYVDTDMVDALFAASPTRACRDSLATARLAAARMRRTIPSDDLLDVRGEDGYGEMMLERMAAEPGPPGPDARASLEAGVRRIQVAALMDDPVTPQLLTQLHAEVSDLRNPARRGAFRTTPVRSRSDEVIYARPESIAPLLARACMAYQMTSADDLLIACALCVAIEAIHPFRDANSRVARLTLSLALARAGYPPIAFDTQRLMRRYWSGVWRWAADDECEPMLALAATECVKEAENRIVYALV